MGVGKSKILCGCAVSTLGASMDSPFFTAKYPTDMITFGRFKPVALHFPFSFSFFFLHNLKFLSYMVQHCVHNSNCRYSF